MGKVVRLRKEGDEYEDYQKRRKTIIVRWAGGRVGGSTPRVQPGQRMYMVTHGGTLHAAPRARTSTRRTEDFFLL